MAKISISSKYTPEADFVLHEGDTLELLKSLPDGLVNLVVTSPPYNLGKPYETRLNLDDYLEQQKLVIQECVRILNPRGSICWQVGNYVKGIFKTDKR